MTSTLERLNERRRQDEGFTLIELLVVIVIIGILAGVVVFAVSGIADRGQESACDADYKAVRTAAEAFYADIDGGEYAEDEAALVSGGYLSELSSLHEYAGTPAGGPYTDFTITETGDCL